jgi:hypothetical protein
MATTFTGISFSRIKAEIERYLREEHNKAGVLFSPASPYGQILSVVENLHSLSMLYLKNAISQFDLNDRGFLNERVVKNSAILAGHIPGRSISATGTIRLTPKTSINIEDEIANGQITLKSKLTLKNKTNSLYYSLNLGRPSITQKVTNGNGILLPIIQGKWEAKSYTGSGAISQTINILELTEKDIENFYVEVYVDGTLWTIKSHIYDLLPDEEALVVRTGFNGGIDLVFGNGNFGKIPTIGQSILCRYLTTDGSLGNIFRRTANDWQFIDDILDSNGSVVDIEKVFDVDIYTDINFGADAESVEFTRSLLPIASNNFVLALPQQYAYHIKRLGVFTHVNAEEKQGTIFIYLTPNIKLFKRQDEDYFSIPIRTQTSAGGVVTYSSAFDLDTYEKNKIVEYLRSGGNIQLTRKFIVKSPTLSFYAINVFVMRYSDATQDSVNSQILNVISNYFLDLKRVDRIPKLDIIRELSNINDIHSVDIQFICKKNEDYHKDGALSLQYGSLKFDSSIYTNISSSNPQSSSMYDPSKVIGLDPVLGDIIFEASELPLIRGGWYDRNGVYFSDESPSQGEGTSLKSVNIVTKGVIDSKNRNSI